MHFFTASLEDGATLISLSFPGICGGVARELSCKGGKKKHLPFGGVVNWYVLLCTEVLNLRSHIVVDLPR